MNESRFKIVMFHVSIFGVKPEWICLILWDTTFSNRQTFRLISRVNENLFDGRYDRIQSGTFPCFVQEELSCCVRSHCYWD